jgi:hypothetical protein
MMPLLERLLMDARHVMRHIWQFHPKFRETTKMSYNVSAFYVAETYKKNRLKSLHKPTVGILSGRNAPLIMTNDTTLHSLHRQG